MVPPPLRWFVRAVAPGLVLLGLWLLFAGSSDSGGAFQSGAVLAGALILLRSAGVPLDRLTVRWLRPLLIVGVIGFIRIMVWQESGLFDYGEHWLFIALSISVSLVMIVLWGTLSGSMIPFILKRFKLDPATSSAPFVATMVDVTGLIIYFTIAGLFLAGKLL